MIFDNIVVKACARYTLRHLWARFVFKTSPQTKNEKDVGPSRDSSMSEKLNFKSTCWTCAKYHSRWNRSHLFMFTDITFRFKYHYCSIKNDTYEWSSLSFRTVTYKFNYVTTSYYVFKIVSRALTYPNWARQWLGNYIERQPFDPPHQSASSKPAWRHRHLDCWFAR